MKSKLSKGSFIDPVRRRYREAQFERLSTEYCEYKTKIRIIKPDGETDWINIEDDEFNQIRAILEGR